MVGAARPAPADRLNGVHLLDPASVTPVPWRNGAGLTRELWNEGPVRISVADLTANAPFSELPGIDRLFVLLSGSITLDGRSLEPGGQMRFGGERPVAAVVHHPGRALNLMIRRGHGSGDITLTEKAPAEADFVILLGQDRFAGITLTPANR
jgi:environmental stress-induced protein Ves